MGLPVTGPHITCYLGGKDVGGGVFVQYLCKIPPTPDRLQIHDSALLVIDLQTGHGYAREGYLNCATTAAGLSAVPHHHTCISCSLMRRDLHRLSLFITLSTPTYWGRVSNISVHILKMTSIL